MGLIAVGIDVGQQVDPTTIAVVEAVERVLVRAVPVPREEWGFPARQGIWEAKDAILVPSTPVLKEVRRSEFVFECRFLERLPLGTPYPQVAERIAQIAAGVAERTPGKFAIFVDATGVGKPVVDMILAAGVAGQVWPVYFTHGDRRAVDHDGVKLGKAWLVSRLQVLLQGDRLRLPRTAEAEALKRELLTYEIRVTAQANDTYGAFKVGTHDDLVTALGLATQVDPVRPKVARQFEAPLS